MNYFDMMVWAGVRMLKTVSRVQLVVRRMLRFIGAVIVATGIGCAAQAALSRHTANLNSIVSR